MKTLKNYARLTSKVKLDIGFVSNLLRQHESVSSSGIPENPTLSNSLVLDCICILVLRWVVLTQKITHNTKIKLQLTGNCLKFLNFITLSTYRMKFQTVSNVI